VQLVSGTQQATSYTTVIQRTTAPYTYIDACGNLTYNKFDQLFDIIKPSYDCSLSNDLIPTPTSSSGIPGPIEYLIRDQNVPLYNYATNIDNYSILQSDNKDLWNIYTSDNLSFTTSISNLYGTLVIRQPVDQYAYSFTIQMPISLFVSGTSNNPSYQPMTDLSLNIQSVSLQVYNNKTRVSLQTQPAFQLNTTTLPSNNTGTATFSNNSAFLKYDIPASPKNAYYFNQAYVGMLSISNIYLYTEPGYIYDFYLTFSINAPFLNKPSYAALYGETTKYGVLCNASTSLHSIGGIENVSTNNGKIPYTKNSISGI
jgi:hypothetical protein